MEKSKRNLVRENIQEENEHIKSYKVLVAALKTELREKDAHIQKLDNKIREHSANTHASISMLPHPEYIKYGENDRLNEARTKSGQDKIVVERDFNRGNNSSSEVILKKQVEVQKTIIAKYEDSNRVLKEQNENLKKSLSETKGIKNELDHAKRQIMLLIRELDQYKSNINIEPRKEVKDTQIQELLKQNEYLRKEIQELQEKLGHLNSFRVSVA